MCVCVEEMARNLIVVVLAMRAEVSRKDLVKKIQIIKAEVDG